MEALWTLFGIAGAQRARLIDQANMQQRAHQQQYDDDRAAVPEQVEERPAPERAADGWRNLAQERDDDGEREIGDRAARAFGGLAVASQPERRADQPSGGGVEQRDEQRDLECRQDPG